MAELMDGNEREINGEPDSPKGRNLKPIRDDKGRIAINKLCNPQWQGWQKKYSEIKPRVVSRVPWITHFIRGPGQFPR